MEKPIQFALNHFLLLVLSVVLLLGLAFFSGFKIGQSRLDTHVLLQKKSILQKQIESGEDAGEIIISNVDANKSFNSPLAKSSAVIRVKSSQQGQYSVEIDVLEDEMKAAVLNSQMKKKGYPSFLSLNDYEGKTFYHVRVGQFGDRDLAEKYAQRINTEAGYSGEVVLVK